MKKDFLNLEKLEKNFDGLDHSKIGSGNLIGVARDLPRIDLDVNLDDAEGILPEDLAEVFQNAIKNMVNTASQATVVSGGDIFLDLAVSSREVQIGGYIPLQYQRYILCSQCEEKNTPEVLRCPKCEGVGRVIAHRRVEIKVPKNVEEGSVLRVASEGHAPATGSGQVHGDLFVKIIIRE